MPSFKLLVMLLTPISIGVVAQLMLKVGISQIGAFSMFDKGIFIQYIKIFMNPYVFFGLTLYFLSTVFWLYLISRVPLSFAYPLLSLSYVFVTLAGAYLFHEKVLMINWVGVLVILLGVVLVAQGRT